MPDCDRFATASHLKIQKTTAMVYPVFMRAISFARPGRTAGRCCLALTVILFATGLAAMGQEPAGFPPAVVTNIAQLRRLSSQGVNAQYSIRLEGNVWWANPTQRKLVLHDQSGTAELELDFHGQPVQSGQRVRLVGNSPIITAGARIARMGTGGPMVAGGAPLPRLEVIGREWFPVCVGLPSVHRCTPGIGFLGGSGRRGDPGERTAGRFAPGTERDGGAYAGGGRGRFRFVCRLAVKPADSRVGFCQSAFTTTGQKVPGVLLVPGRRGNRVHRNRVQSQCQWRHQCEKGRCPVDDRRRHQPDETGGSRARYPVKIQGVIISVVSNRPAFIVQDATRAVYVVVDSATISELPQVGTYLKVEGKTDKGSFAPIVRARQVNVLGLGNLPEPSNPPGTN